MERVVFSGVKAYEIESQGEGEPKRRDKYPPAQKAFAVFRLRAGQSLFGERKGFPVIDVAHERQKTENDNEYADDTYTGDQISHFSSQKTDTESALLYQPPPCLFSDRFPRLLFTGIDIHTTTVGFYSKLFAAAVDASHDLSAIGIGTSICDDCNRQFGIDGTEIGFEVDIQL